MLTRIYIDNFRCFVNFEYAPESRQLLLGENGSGKSSLLTAIRYIKRFVNGDENPFTQSTRTRWQDRPLQVFEIEAVLDNRKYEYRVEIGFAPESRQPSVSLERLRVGGATAFELSGGELRFFPNGGTRSTTVPLETSRSQLYLSQLSNSDVQRFVDWLKSVHCFRFDEYPDAMDEIADRGGAISRRRTSKPRRMVSLPPRRLPRRERGVHVLSEGCVGGVPDPQIHFR